MIEIGKVNHLIVNRESSSGYYLKDLKSGEEVFMPPSMAPVKVRIDQDIAAFVYLDTKGGKVATSNIPCAVVGEYARMRVIDTQDFGAFLDWGIDKDLLVPGNEQKIKMRLFDDYVVRVCLEEGTNRIYGTTKLGKYIESSDFDIAPGDNIKIVPVQQTELGYRVIINRKFIGIIYENEIFKKVRIGETYDGVVKKLRTDGLVDAALQAQGINNLLDSKEIVLRMLFENNGESSLHDKSSPDDIKRVLGISKKSFKSAIGMLYKEKKITISKTGIKLAKDDN